MKHMHSVTNLTNYYYYHKMKPHCRLWIINKPSTGLLKFGDKISKIFAELYYI